MQITNSRELRVLLQNMISSAEKLDDQLIEEFIAEAQFDNEELVGMKYSILTSVLTYDQFTDFLNAVGITPMQFEQLSPSCGKNYKSTGTSIDRSCSSTEGHYCKC